MPGQQAALLHMVKMPRPVLPFFPGSFGQLQTLDAMQPLFRGRMHGYRGQASTPVILLRLALEGGVSCLSLARCGFFVGTSWLLARFAMLCAAWYPFLGIWCI